MGRMQHFIYDANSSLLEHVADVNSRCSEGRVHERNIKGFTELLHIRHSNGMDNVLF